jgi:hypothetical protein
MTEIKKKKQSYEKPGLRAISLVAEEVLGIACKRVKGAPGALGGKKCGITPCSGLGS